jgi:hypothetical protein
MAFVTSIRRQLWRHGTFYTKLTHIGNIGTSEHINKTLIAKEAISNPKDLPDVKDSQLYE